ncbi:MAG: hypothetical protein WCP97_01580 [bacterium]
MNTKTKTIFIRLLNEGTEVWRPVEGLSIRDNIYQLLPTDDYDPQIEEWEFKPGTYVYCEFTENKFPNKPSKSIFTATKKA